MAFPTIQVNNATGSDTAASGAGPSTALFGAAAATAASVIVTLLVDNPDLSGVATDGSACLWVKSSSGKQFAKITGVDNTAGVKTVTVANAYANTESGKTWGIGGKRKTLDHADTRKAGSDWLAGWSIDVQDGQTLTSAFALLVGTSTVTGSTPATLYSSVTPSPLITTSTNSINLFNISGSDPLVVHGLAFSNTAGTRGTAQSTGMAFTPKTATCHGLEIVDCTFDGFVSAVMGDNITNFNLVRLVMVGCEIKNCTDRGIGILATVFLDRCYIHDNTGDGVVCGGGTAIITNCVFAVNAKGFNNSGGGTLVFDHCDFKSNTASGIDIAGTSSILLVVHDCIFDSNGAYGIKLTAGQAASAGNFPAPLLARNTYRNNSTGTVLNGPPQFSDVTTTGSPFVSSTDFGLNSTAGAGTACKASGTVALNATANTAGDLGAIPSGGGAAAATGGGSKQAGIGGGLAG